VRSSQRAANSSGDPAELRAIKPRRDTKDVSRQRSSLQVDVHVLLFQQRPRWNSGVFISGMEEKKVLVL
jgi:hypothetical protein